MTKQTRLAIIAAAAILLNLWTSACAAPAPTATSTSQLPAVASTVTITPRPTAVTPTVTGTPTPLALINTVVLRGFEIAPDRLAWSPDGTVLATASSMMAAGASGSGGFDPVIRLWKTDGTLISALRDHQAPIQSLDWSPDGKTLASGSLDGTIRLWSPGGEAIGMIEPKAGGVFAVAWSPDGSVLASASIVSFENPTVHLWKPDGTLIATMGTQYSGGKFYNLEWSPDGKWLVGGATDYKLWRADGTEIYHAEACASCTPAWGFAWSPDSRHWATGNESGVLSIYDVEGGEPRGSTYSGGGVDPLVWSPDGSVLAGGDGAALWNSGGSMLRQADGVAQVTDIAWEPGGAFAAAASARGKVYIFSPGGDAILTLEGHEGPAIRVAWSPDGKWVASGSEDGTVRLWEVAVGN